VHARISEMMEKQWEILSGKLSIPKKWKA